MKQKEKEGSRGLDSTEQNKAQIHLYIPSKKKECTCYLVLKKKRRQANRKLKN